MIDPFQLAKREIIVALFRMLEWVKRDYGWIKRDYSWPFEHWKSMAHPVTYWSRVLGTGKVFDYESNPELIDVHYPMRASTDEPLFDGDGWYLCRTWVERGKPSTLRDLRWRRAVLEHRLLPAFKAMDGFYWHTPEYREVMFAAAPYAMHAMMSSHRGVPPPNFDLEFRPKMSFERARFRARRLPRSAMTILDAFADRLARSAGRPQRHDLLRETGLKESTLDYAMREVLKPQGLVVEHECFYEVTPRGWTRYGWLR